MCLVRLEISHLSVRFRTTGLQTPIIAAIGTGAANWRFVRFADLQPVKMLRNGRMAALGKLQRSNRSLAERQVWAVS